MLIALNFSTDLCQTTTELDPSSKKFIRQCLRQFDLLKNVWQTILPTMEYNKTMGKIINDFSNEIIRRILIIDDIPSSVCNDLVTILNTIIERVLDLFEVRLRTGTFALF